MRMFHYELFMPKPDARGSTMLDTYGGETPNSRAYESVFAGAIRLPETGEEATLQACDALWQRHNVGDEGDDNRPRPQDIRSMSIGDILRFQPGGEVYVVESVGFRLLTGNAIPDLDTSRAWQDVNHRSLPRIIYR